MLSVFQECQDKGAAKSRADRLALAESKETTELVTDKSFNLPPILG